MGFRLVSKSVTLNDLERRNGSYSALFLVVKKFIFAISSPDEFLVIYFDNKTYGHIGF